MESFSSYLQYRTKVIDLLIAKIEPTIAKDKNIQICYLYKNYNFDLVVLDSQDKILKIYEIQAFSATKSNINTIKDLLKGYEESTNAQAFLVYLDKGEKLQIKSISDLAIMKKGSNVRRHYTIDSFSKFYKIINQICNNNDDGYSGLQYFFRGHSSIHFKCIPGIFRSNCIASENQMYHEAIRKNPLVFTEDMSTFDKLVKMQHYELPTRLLDITSNPLVALYFACLGDYDTDGSVLIFPVINDKIKYYDSIPVCILSNLTKCSEKFSYKENKDELVFAIQEDMTNYNAEDLIVDDITKVYCVMPKLNNERIIRQHGAFFIFGMGLSKNEPSELKDMPITIQVKANCKRRILKELEVLGIDEAALFPETDKIMKQIKSSYN